MFQEGGRILFFQSVIEPSRRTKGCPFAEKPCLIIPQGPALMKQVLTS